MCLFHGVIFFKTFMNFDSFLFLRLSVSGALRRFSETKLQNSAISYTTTYFLFPLKIFLSASENYIHVYNEISYCSEFSPSSSSYSLVLTSLLNFVFFLFFLFFNNP